jgi:DMSO/TMAO reductase YedYZ molybdopterin-dependent catalytic subunit
VLAVAAAYVLAGKGKAAQGRNVSYPLEDLTSTVNPADAFFERDHFSVPELSLRNWTLRIEGRVSKPYTLNMSDLLEGPESSVEALLECAGNGPDGAAVGNGIWQGLSLASILQAARPDADGTEVLLEGADAGTLRENTPVTPYRRLVPLARCLKPETMIAVKLNGRLLPQRHGFPARVILPGRYGMDSVKWLQRIRVLGANETPPAAHENGMDQLYRRTFKPGAGGPPSMPVTELLVKSVIAWPQSAVGDTVELPAGKHRVWGFAWTGGGGTVRQVEISSDGGRTWEPATLDTVARRFTWVKWGYTWEARPGRNILMSRATDAAGLQQPLMRDPDRLDAYELNWCAPLRCTVF